MQQLISPPTSLLEALQALRYEDALNADDPRYVDTREARGSQQTLNRLAKKLGCDLKQQKFFPPASSHVLFFGHVGSGKTTELRQYARALADSGFIYGVEVDVLSRLDRNNLQYSEVLLAMAEALVEHLSADGCVAATLTLAPDWWAWRAGVYVFTTEPTPMQAEGARPQFDRYRKRPTQVQAGKRIAELREWLQGELEPELAWRLWGELGDIYYTQGWLDQALEAYQQYVLPLLQMLSDARSVAATKERIADILAKRGQSSTKLYAFVNRTSCRCSRSWAIDMGRRSLVSGAQLSNASAVY